jgi:hypothetical protein
MWAVWPDAGGEANKIASGKVVPSVFEVDRRYVAGRLDDDVARCVVEVARHGRNRSEVAQRV